MANILIIYSTTDGQTRNICQRLKGVIERRHQVTLLSIDDCAKFDLHPYEMIVIGASVRYGKHSPLVIDLINRNQQLLESKSSAFFSVSLVARKPGKNRPETNPYLQNFFDQITWRPKLLAVFAGKIDYPNYLFIDRLIIRLIMWVTHGPTDPDAVIEFTDWQQVENFGRLISDAAVAHPPESVSGD